MARTRTRAAQREEVNIGGPRPAPEYPARITVSEATRQDLTKHGEVVHAGTGLVLRVGDEGMVCAYHRGTGEQVETEVRCPRIDWTPED
jgi:hypothetical protein